MKPNIKGQVEIQFNWIFILIAGAIILAFFVSLAMSQKGASDIAAKTNFLINFEKAVSGISASEGKTLIFKIPNMDLHYDCTADCYCGAYSGVSRAKAGTDIFTFRDQIVFSPNYLKGDQLLTWSEEWSYPFRVTNFLYITSPQVKYLIEDSELGRKIYDKLPEKTMESEQNSFKNAMDKELFNLTDISSLNLRGNYKVKFILTNVENPELDITIPSELQNLPSSDVTAIKIDGNKVIFYEKSKLNKTKFTKSKNFESYLFGDSTIIAAVISEDVTAYNCMMNRAFKSLSIVSNIYAEKELKYSEIAPECGVFYQGQASQISSISKTIDFSKKTDLERSVQTIISLVYGLKIQNENMLKESCPYLY